MTALAYAQATARARRDIVTAKEIRLVSAANLRMRHYCEVLTKIANEQLKSPLIYTGQRGKTITYVPARWHCEALTTPALVDFGNRSFLHWGPR